MCQLLLLFSLLVLIQSAPYFSSLPIWKTNDYFRAGNKRIVEDYVNATVIGQMAPPLDYPFLFSTAFLNGIPSLAYGLKGYSGRYKFI
jgi:hypothetical protein